MADKTRYVAGRNSLAGKIVTMNDSSLDTNLVAWNKMKVLIDKSVKGNQTFSNGIVSTYSLVYTTSFAYYGGVLAPNGDIHFVPCNATVGQKISTLPAIPFSDAICSSPFYNKY